MRKIFFLLPTLLFPVFQAFTQCCGEKIKFDDWLYESCVSSNKAFQILANNLPEGRACYAKVDNMFYLAFRDAKGQRHLGVASGDNHETFQVSVFEDSAATEVFSAIFMLNGVDKNLKLLWYEEKDEYVRPKAPFQNFNEYWQKYFLSQHVPNHQ